VEAGRKPFLDVPQSIAQALVIEIRLAIATGRLAQREGWRNGKAGLASPRSRHHINVRSLQALKRATTA
jgi:hypothetical protein